MDSTMLVIDDSEINREILKVLFGEKFLIMEAENGQEARAMIEGCQGNIDVILLDLIMPGFSGFDLLKERQTSKIMKDIPVVVISSSGAMEDQVKAFELGASDFVNKPFVPEIVVSRVNNVIYSHERMQMIELKAEKLKVKSELDQMTGIYNKTTTELTINKLLKTATGQLHALLVIDIDYFKSVNDVSGHLVGDHVIKIIADLISSHFRKTDIVGRVGGDEFAVLVNNVPSMEVVRNKVNELVLLMKYKPNLTIPENVSLSIGVAQNERKEINYADLFAKADDALHRAKADGKACYREYGVESINVMDEDKPCALLISRDRSACSVIHAIIPKEVCVIEVLTIESLDKVKEAQRSRIKVVYADVSDYSGDAKDYWEELREHDWIELGRTIAVCEEGNMAQYAMALNNHVVDILTSPMDSAQAKRRTTRLLKKQAVIEEIQE